MGLSGSSARSGGLSRDELQREVLALLRERGRAVLIAPTGFGKSTLLVRNWGEVERWGKVVHCLPLRAVVSDVVRAAYERLGCSRADALVGYQAGVDIRVNGALAHKNPYLLSVYCVTTYDSYSLTLLLSAVPELARARVHSDVSYAAIALSLNMFDEVHVLARADELAYGSAAEDQLKSFAFLRAVTEYFTEIGVPLLYASATVAPRVLQAICPPGVPVVVVGGSYLVSKYREALGGRVVERPLELVPELRAQAEEYLSRVSTRVTKEGLTRVATEAAAEGHGATVVYCNTVPRAVGVYKVLTSKLGERVMLVHGRLGRADRERRLSAIKRALEEGRELVVVSTQVLEAGADLSFDCMVSEVATPESLIQRAGRVLRWARHIEAGEGLVVIDVSEPSLLSAKAVYPADVVDLTAELLARTCPSGERALDWRYGVTRDTAYRVLLEVYDQASVELTELDLIARELRGMLSSNYVRLTALGACLRDLLEDFEERWMGSVVRSSSLARLVVRSESGEDVVDVSHDLLARKWREWLEVRDGCVVALFYASTPGDEEVGELEVAVPVRTFELALRRPLTGHAYLAKLAKREWGRSGVRLEFRGYLVRPEAYDPEVGLV